MAILKHLTLAALCGIASAYTYDVSIVSKAPTPPLSIHNQVGQGYSPCTYTFNPAWFPVSPGLNSTILVVRAAGCPAEYGGGSDHLLFAYCEADGTCGDVQPLNFTAFPAGAEDPRVFYYQGQYYLYMYAPGPGQHTVYLYRTATPLNVASWELVVGQLNWHRNGCVILREDGNHYVIWGETSAIGIGISMTRDFVSYTTLNATWLEPLGANNTDEPEIVLEAATTPVQLSTGDYLHLYAAGTPGWVANGNYTGGWIILDKDDPTRILQRSTTHLFGE